METEFESVTQSGSRSKHTQEYTVTTEILQSSVIARTFVSETSDYKHSELSGKQKDLIVETWHFVENHLDEVYISIYILI